MQATVHQFDPETRSGSVLTDDGVLLAFDAAAFDAGGLRKLRTGQRLSIELSAAAGTGPARIVRLRLGSILPPAPY